MTNKPFLIFCGPVETVSGYGSHARDLVLSLIEMDKFNIKIISLNQINYMKIYLNKNINVMMYLLQT